MPITISTLVPDVARARVLTRASLRLDRRMASRIMTAIVDRPPGSVGARSQLGQELLHADGVVLPAGYSWC